MNRLIFYFRYLVNNLCRYLLKFLLENASNESGSDSDNDSSLLDHDRQIIWRVLNEDDLCHFEFENENMGFKNLNDIKDNYQLTSIYYF